MDFFFYSTTYTESGTTYWIFKGFIEAVGANKIIRVDAGGSKLYAHNITLTGPYQAISYAPRAVFTLYTSSPTQMNFSDIVTFLTNAGYTGENDFKGYNCSARLYTSENSMLNFISSIIYVDNGDLKINSLRFDKQIFINDASYHISPYVGMGTRNWYTFSSSVTTVTDTVVEV